MYLLVMMCLGINGGFDVTFHRGGSYFFFLDLKKKLDGDCIFGNKNETEVCAIS